MNEAQSCRHRGLGANNCTDLKAVETRRAYTNAYYMVNQSSYTPLKWHASWGASIPKQNGKKKALGQRVVHRLCEQGKAFFSEKLKAKEREAPAAIGNLAQGFVKGRRRESGILSQLSCMWRARRAKRSGFGLNLDMANAFGSGTWESLEEINKNIFKEEDL